MHPIEMVIYLLQSLLSQHGTLRFWFWPKQERGVGWACRQGN